LLGAAGRAAHRNRFEYFHFLQPNPHVPGAKSLTAEERRELVDGALYRPIVEAAYPMLAHAGGALSRAGVRFTDLTGMFVDTTETVYRDGCCHLNARGNEMLADAIAAAILAAAERGGGRHAD
jgi:hypothetical protein